MTRVGYCYDRLFLEHDAGAGHPERPARLDAVNRGLHAAGLLDSLSPIAPRPATRDELMRVHSAAHVERIAATAGLRVQLDPDTSTSPRSYETARLAAGAAVVAVQAVLDGAIERAFCSVRPPGHHATREEAMGFCLFNNVAAAAAAALARGLERVAVVDFDVHHGNGTQDIFWSEPRVLVVSSHQYPFYPGTGSLEEQGGGAGEGFTVNLPMPAGSGDADYVAVYREIVQPIVRSFNPRLVLVSAGFDAAAGDPLAGMRVSPTGFGDLADVCVAAASGAAKGRVVAILEGGYGEEGLASGARALVGRLLETDAPSARSAVTPPGAAALVAAFRQAHHRHWPVLRD